MTIKLAIPNKGRLNERALELLSKSGINLGEEWGRRLYIESIEQDLEILFVRAQDIPAFIALGAVDFGITGEDMVAESGYPLKNIQNLDFGICRLSVAAPESSGIKTIDDIPSGSRIATSFPKLTKEFFKSKGKDIAIVTISGAAEIMPYLNISDFITDLIATGSTLKINRLTEIGKIMDSQAAIFTSEEALSKNKQKITDIVDSIKSVIDAEDKKYLMADVPKDKIGEIQKLFPGIGGPTILDIAGNDEMIAMQVVINSSDMYKSINLLKKLGAKGILSLSIDQLVE